MKILAVELNCGEKGEKVVKMVIKVLIHNIEQYIQHICACE